MQNYCLHVEGALLPTTRCFTNELSSQSEKNVGYQDCLDTQFGADRLNSSRP